MTAGRQVGTERDEVFLGQVAGEEDNALRLVVGQSGPRRTGGHLGNPAGAGEKAAEKDEGGQKQHPCLGSLHEKGLADRSGRRKICSDGDVRPCPGILTEAAGICQTS